MSSTLMPLQASGGAVWGNATIEVKADYGAFASKTA